MSSNIAVVGISVEVPGAKDQHGFWDVVASGRTLTRPHPPRRVKDVENYISYLTQTAVKPPDEAPIVFHDGCYLDEPEYFDAEFFGMTPKQAATAEPHLRLALRAMYLALEDAGYDAPLLRGTSTGVYVGFATNPGQTYLDYLARIDRSLVQVALTGNVPTMIANRLSHFLDLRGPSMVVDSACSASLVAVHQAKNALLLGDCEMAVVAGVRIVPNAVRHPDTAIGIESSDGRTRTLDERADGTGFGEGAGAVVLKRLERAVADGDRIYAVIKGSAINHDGRDGGITTPDSGSQAALLKSAWANAGVDPRSIGYLELHGTATRLGDPIEYEGLRQAFAEYTTDRRFCAVGTVKANIGHLFEGSGVLGLIKTVLVLRHGVIPPLAGFERPNPAIDFDAGPVRVPTGLEPWVDDEAPRRAAVSAFGLGGTNCHVVLEQYTGTHASAPRRVSPPDTERLFTLAAHTEQSLRMLVRAYVEYFANDRFAATTLTDLCYTANRSRSSHRHRLALVVGDMAELRERLEALDAGLESWHGRGDTDARLRAAAEAFVATGTLDLRALYEDCQDRPRIVDLPGYRFDERRCWIDFPARWRGTRPAADDAEAYEPDPVAHSVMWAPDDPVLEPNGDPYAQVLALIDPATDAETMLRAAGFGDARILHLKNLPQNEADGTPSYEQIAEMAVDGGFTHLVYALAFEDGPPGDVTELDRRVRKNLHGLFLLVRALMTAGASLHLAVLTNKALAAVPGEAGVAADNGALVGLAKAIEREYPYITISCVDVDATVPPELLRDEILAAQPGVHVLRDRTRLREQFAELPVIEPAATQGHDGKGGYLRRGGTYLITGGTGGIGLQTCRMFAGQQPGINLVLLSRSGAPPREQWRANPTALTTVLSEIENKGARVEVLAVDAGDPAALTEAVTAIQRRHGRIDGIVHAAGIPGERVIAFRTEDEFAAVIRPKIYGAYVLDALTAHDRPDFIAYFSSVAALFPAIGQADYAAANYYLDNLARAQAGGPSHVIAFDWVAWKETGMAVATGANMDTTFKALPTEPGLTVLDEGLRSGLSRVFGGQVHYDGDFVQVLPSYHVSLDPAIEAKIGRAAQARSERRERAARHVRERILGVEVKLTGRPDGCYTPAEWLVARCWADVFGFTEIDVDADFFDLGGDSITAISLMTTVTTCTGVELNAADLLVERSVAALGGLVGEALPDGAEQLAAFAARSSAASV